MRLFVFNLTIKNITLSIYIVISSISTNLFYYSNPKTLNNIYKNKVSLKFKFLKGFFLDFLQKERKDKYLKREQIIL